MKPFLIALLTATFVATTASAMSWSEADRINCGSDAKCIAQREAARQSAQKQKSQDQEQAAREAARQEWERLHNPDGSCKYGAFHTGICMEFDPYLETGKQCVLYMQKNCKAIVVSKTNCANVNVCYWHEQARVWSCHVEQQCDTAYSAVCNGSAPKTSHVHALEGALYCSVDNSDHGYNESDLTR